MKRIAICIVVAASMASAQSAVAETWVRFFTNKAHHVFYYEKDSLIRLGKNRVQVWYKSVPKDDAELKSWVEWLELRETDCERRRYRRLAGSVARDLPAGEATLHLAIRVSQPNQGSPVTIASEERVTLLAP